MTQAESEPEVAKKAAVGGKKKVPKLSLAKPAEPPPKHWITRLVMAPGMLAAIWPVALVIGGYVAWNQWGAERIGQQFYGLEQVNLTATKPPGFLKSDVISEVFQTHQLEKTSLLDRKATVAIGEAFRTHPWVSEVLRVEKKGTGVSVQLRYRHPVAVVRVPNSRHPEVQGPGIFFVDGQGVLLPSRDFQEVEQYQFLQIEIQDDTYPSGGYGAPFGDQRVVSAAKIAAYLAAYRERHRLVTIRLTNPQRTFNEPFIYEVIRADGERFIWGSPPGEELAGELFAQQKIELLNKPTAPPKDWRLAVKPAI